jgi:transcriptional regulator with XRE-family HTH domain
MTTTNVFITGTQSRLAREALNLNLKEVAEQANLGVNTISRFEQTGRVGAVMTVRKLVEVYSRHGIEFPDTRTIRLPEALADAA